MSADPARLENVIDQYRHLVSYAVRRFRWAIGQQGISKDDLESEATIGIIKAHNRFDPGRRNRQGQLVQFSSFAIPYVLGEVRRFLWKFQSVKVSQSVYELAGKILKNGLTEASASTITEHIKCNEVAAQRALNYLRESKTSSINAPVGEEQSTLSDLLPAIDDPTEADVSIFIDELNPIERELLRYMMKGTEPEEAARQLGISTTRIKCTVSELRRKAQSYFEYEEGSIVSQQISKQKYIADKGDGLSDDKIAKKYGVSTSHVNRLKKQWDLVGMTVRQPQSPSNENAVSVVSITQPIDDWKEKYKQLAVDFESARQKCVDLEEENGLLKALLRKYI